MGCLAQQIIERLQENLTGTRNQKVCTSQKKLLLSLFLLGSKWIESTAFFSSSDSSLFTWCWVVSIRQSLTATSY